MSFFSSTVIAIRGKRKKNNPEGAGVEGVCRQSLRFFLGGEEGEGEKKQEGFLSLRGTVRCRVWGGTYCGW